MRSLGGGVCLAPPPQSTEAGPGVVFATRRADARTSQPGSTGCGRPRRHCPRDVLPLPRCVAATLEPPFATGRSRQLPCRAVRRRAERRYRKEQLCSDVTHSLNDLWCGNSDGAGFGHDHPSGAQSLVHSRVERAIDLFGSPPVGMTGPGALEALRVCGPGGYEVDAQGARASYNASLVALPSEGSIPTPLDRLWGAGGRDFVEAFCETKAVPSLRAKARLEELGLAAAYTDPAVLKGRNWSSFLRRLEKRGVVEFVEEEPTELVGMFFVRKKNGDLRLVIDCRRSNCHFSAPEGVELATGSCLSQLEMGPNDLVRGAMRYTNCVLPYGTSSAPSTFLH